MKKYSMHNTFKRTENNILRWHPWHPVHYHRSSCGSKLYRKHEQKCTEWKMPVVSAKIWKYFSLVVNNCSNLSFKSLKQQNWSNVFKSCVFKKFDFMSHLSFPSKAIISEYLFLEYILHDFNLYLSNIECDMFKWSIMNLFGQKVNCTIKCDWDSIKF